MLGFPMDENKNVRKPKAQSIMEFIEGLIHYFVNLGYGKCIKQFVTLKLYNELKLESTAIKVTKFLFIKVFMLNFHLHDLYTNKKIVPMLGYTH